MARESATLYVPKPHPCRLSCIVIIMDDSAETVVSIYSEVSNLGTFKWLGRVRRGAAAMSDRWVRCSLQLCVPKITSAQVKRHADTREVLHRDGPVGVPRDVRSGQVQGAGAGPTRVLPRQVIGGYGARCSAARTHAAPSHSTPEKVAACKKS